MENYQLQIPILSTANEVFKALAQAIPSSWWTEMFEGNANATGEEFTVRFGDQVYKTMEVVELVEGARVVWKVKQSLIAIPELKNQKEWEGTSIVWLIRQQTACVNVHLEPRGLHAKKYVRQVGSNL